MKIENYRRTMYNSCKTKRNKLSACNFQNNSISCGGEPSSLTPSYLNLITGDKSILEDLNTKIKKHKIRANFLYDPALRWPRDCRVVLANRKHLIPASLAIQEDKIFYSLLPNLMLHFIAQKESYAGNGMCDAYQERAKDDAKKCKIPYLQGLSCIEGGNCHIFQGADGKPKAIVGYTSLILTTLSLLNEGVLEKHALKLKEYKEKHPKISASDSFRIARNFINALHGKDCILEQPLEHGEKELWLDGAGKVEVLFVFAKQTIADELEIPLERIAFVFQERFHIDMELFTGPNDFVFLHDEKLTLDLLQKIDFPFPFLKKTRKYSESHLAINQKILEENTKALEKIDCKAIRVPGVLTAKYETEKAPPYSQILADWTGEEVALAKEYQESKTPQFVTLLNFMNGLFFASPTPRWITARIRHKNHPITNFFKKAFLEAIHAVCPELDISFLRTAHLPTHLIIGSGGLRCLVSPF